MFGIGLLELVVIAVLGVLVVGPEKMPDLARQAASLLKSAKQVTESVRDELRENLGPEYADLEITDLHPRSLVRKHVFEVLQDNEPLDDDEERERPEDHKYEHDFETTENEPTVREVS
jgi:sec-independent protein translocase protein TatB